MPADLIFLIDLAARSAIVLGFAWAVILAMPKLSAAARYWIWLTALCALPLLPLSTAVFPTITLIDLSAEPDTSPSAAEITNSRPVLPMIEATISSSSFPKPESNPTSSPQPKPTAVIPEPDSKFTPNTIPITPLIYLIGIVGLLLPLAVGLLRLRKLRRTAIVDPDDELLDAIHQYQEIHDPEGRAQILVSAAISIPLTWGTRRPIILLPESAAAWSPARLLVVLAHEFAHIARRDFATGLAASVLRAAFWLQPLAWFAHRRLQIEREIACDDRVLQSRASSAPDYAEHLSAVVKDAERRHLSAGIAMARPSEIVSRVRAILDCARNRGAISPQMKGRVLLLALVLFAPLAFVRCAGEKSASNKSHKTGIGIVLKVIDPAGITIARDGKTTEIPSGTAFSMAEREVTQDEFQQILGHNPSSSQAAHLPVDRVTRTEAASFCKALTERDRAAGVLPKGKVYRLPTRREWLIAALPGGLIPGAEALESVAWHRDNSANQLHSVAAKKANAYGLHDMLGNAAEWTDPDSLAAELGTGKYRGKVTIQLHHTEGEGRSATFMQTQAQIIASRETLLQVARENNLNARWATGSDDESVDKLASAVRTTHVRGTDLIEIAYYSDDPGEAADIANAIAEAYKDRRYRRESDVLNGTLQELQEEVQSQEKKLQASRDAMLKLMKDSGFVDLGTGGPAWARGSSLDTGAEMLVRRSKQAEYEAKLELEGLRTTLKTLENLEGDELIKAAVELGINNPTLVNRYPEYESARLALAALKDSGLGGKHPRVVQAQATIEMHQKLLVDATETTKKTLLTKLAIAEKNLESSKLTKAEAEENSIDEKRRSIEYLAAKDEYQLHKNLIADMRQRLARGQIDRKMPKHAIEVHERAAVPNMPTAPGADRPSAMGGTAFDTPSALLDARASGGAEQRTAGVGFRFVMADE